MINIEFLHACYKWMIIFSDNISSWQLLILWRIAQGQRYSQSESGTVPKAQLKMKLKVFKCDFWSNGWQRNRSYKIKGNGLYKGSEGNSQPSSLNMTYI